MVDYRQLYKKIKDEFEVYQNFTEEKLLSLTNKNIELEKNLDAMANIVEISKYINSSIEDENLISMINDMIIGILGVMYSTVYIKNGNEIEIMATNKKDKSHIYFDGDKLKLLEKDEPFVINSKSSVHGLEEENYDINIHSVIGVPIRLREKFIGYIVVEHTHFNFFNPEHIKFISAIANQIAIAIENNQLYQKIKELAVRDPLLGIYNRRYFFEEVLKYIANNKERSFAVIMVDIDFFKLANDRFGHQFGDEVLRSTSRILTESFNSNSMVARYGGEEFVIFVPEIINARDVWTEVENTRKRISENMVRFGDKHYSVTASFGVSFYPYNGTDIDSVISNADNMLYKAKQTGRNKVMMSEFSHL
ncbi:sensor domain-containing diguanylate cyclase [Clostridium oryzae]|uniref:Diguanylate cyclase VdcA n=1 Tax=Clostridium oryzae TaxID=1450648 RepID=A0A1V4IKT9_9CLOT|nr:GGDEF domain-containing protein [Clostridium oryzae]OPJ60097.1 diguanylate cyclase VdcA [Clostridium oryzae]